MENIVSHPGNEQGENEIKLEDHLMAVAEKTEENLPDKIVVENELSHLGYLAGIFHDIAKCTPQLQKYLKTGNSSYQHPHAPLSAIIAKVYMDKQSYPSYEQYVVFFTIAKHHGRIADKTPENYIHDNYVSSDSFDEHFSYAESIEESDSARKFVDGILSKLRGKVSYSEHIHKTMKDDKSKTISDLSTNDFGMYSEDAFIRDETYNHLLLTWAALGFSDLIHVKQGMSFLDSSPPSDSTVEEYVRNQLASEFESEEFSETVDEGRELNYYREKARRDTMESVENVDWEKCDVAEISLPTGLGKTITGTNAGLNILSQVGGSGSLIYCLPYTSIIDQTKNNFEDIFGDQVLTTHHYLSETTADDREGEVSDEELRRFLGRTWKNGIVLTTFVQLFESLLTPTRTKAAKIPSLQDSVVVLDEPQALPNDWWPLVRELVHTLSEYYNTKFISMTATHPYILREDDRLKVTTVQSGSEYSELSAIERVKYDFHESVFESGTGIPMEKKAMDIHQDLKSNLSTLTICNTIDSAQKLFEQVDAILDGHLNLNQSLNQSYKKGHSRIIKDKDVVAVGHLTSRHRMRDRELILKRAQSLLNQGFTVCLISTQIVEAGVDISFDKVHRDFAPIQSIIQAAGRCNRNLESEKPRNVSVFQLEDGESDDKVIPSELVYADEGANLLKVTRDCLRQHLDESGGYLEQHIITQNVVRMYYDELKSRNIGNEQYAKYLRELYLDEVDNINMIDSTDTVEILVARNHHEMEVIEKLQELADKQEYAKIRKMKTDISDMQVSLPVYNSEQEDKLSSLNMVHDRLDYRVVEPEDISNDGCYDPILGAGYPEVTVGNRII